MSNKFGPTAPQPYPPEMRTQLWPLCCGASILSGFKNIGTVTDDDLVRQINSTIDEHVPDLQVYKDETIVPKLTFLTLNQGQMNSAKIMGAIKKAGFVQFAEAKPRGGTQGFFVRDKSKTFAPVEIAKVG